MTKKWLLPFVALVLAGCAVSEDEEAARRAENREIQRMTEGCTLLRDSHEYAECLRETYAKNHPKTYTTGMLEDGAPVAIVTSGKCNTAPIYGAVKEKDVEITTKKVVVSEIVVPQKEITVEVETPKEKGVTVTETERVVSWDVDVPPKPVLVKKETVVAPQVNCPCADSSKPCLECAEK